MTSEGIAESSAEEARLAREELSGAAQLLKVGLVRIALTRAYFAVFHALRSLVYSANLEPRTHHGVIHLFTVNFIKTGQFEPATSMQIMRLQKYREEADYGDAFAVDVATATREVEQARVLVERILAAVRSA